MENKVQNLKMQNFHIPWWIKTGKINLAETLDFITIFRFSANNSQYLWPKLKRKYRKNLFILGILPDYNKKYISCPYKLRTNNDLYISKIDLSI